AKQHRKVERHSNILKFYGITREERHKKNYIFVLEYANNGNLSNYLKSNFNTMDWNVKLKFARQIASAVNHLHENKIVHRDLHSKNILIHNGNIKICDFGIAKFLLDPSLEVSKRLGSIKYSDPQYLNNTKNYSRNEKSDIYSIGILLWQISSGHAPFTYESIQDLTLAIILGEREAIIKGTPKKYAKIYTECWQGKPDLRPHIHQVMQDLCNVDITDIVEDTDQTNNELQNDDLLHSKEIPLSAQIDSLNNQLKDLDKAQAGIAEILQLYYGEFLFHHTKGSTSFLTFNAKYVEISSSTSKETEQNYEVDQNQPQIEETDVNCEPRREETEDNSDAGGQSREQIWSYYKTNDPDTYGYRDVTCNCCPKHWGHGHLGKMETHLKWMLYQQQKNKKNTEFPGYICQYGPFVAGEILRDPSSKEQHVE
ncbi:6951_t:CDS:2, partial [Entrophospora sp. SA101]